MKYLLEYSRGYYYLNKNTGKIKCQRCDKIRKTWKIMGVLSKNNKHYAKSYPNEWCLKCIKSDGEAYPIKAKILDEAINEFEAKCLVLRL